MKNTTICKLSEELRCIARTIKRNEDAPPEISKELMSIANTMQRKGARMEKRLKEYRTAIQKLGFQRIKETNDE